jgi:hypothetical protein
MKEMGYTYKDKKDFLVCSVAVFDMSSTTRTGILMAVLRRKNTCNGVILWRMHALSCFWRVKYGAVLTVTSFMSEIGRMLKAFTLTESLKCLNWPTTRTYLPSAKDCLRAIWYSLSSCMDKKHGNITSRKRAKKKNMAMNLRCSFSVRKQRGMQKRGYAGLEGELTLSAHCLTSITPVPSWME